MTKLFQWLCRLRYVFLWLGLGAGVVVFYDMTTHDHGPTTIGFIALGIMIVCTAVGDYTRKAR
jgi:hypothetical protein